VCVVFLFVCLCFLAVMCGVVLCVTVCLVFIFVGVLCFWVVFVLGLCVCFSL